MKRMSHIAQELRAKGRKFSQTMLMNELATFTPLFQEGKVVFYADSVVDDLMGRFKVRPPVIVEEVPVPTQDNQLDKIQRMLEAICKSLELEVA